jgi:hypothetical protein
MTGALASFSYLVKENEEQVASTPDTKVKHTNITTIFKDNQN